MLSKIGPAAERIAVTKDFLYRAGPAQDLQELKSLHNLRRYVHIYDIRHSRTCPKYCDG